MFENNEFVQRVDFEKIDLLKKLYKVLFDEWYNKFAFERLSVDKSAAGKLRGLGFFLLRSTCVIKLNLVKTLSSKTRTLYSS